MQAQDVVIAEISQLRNVSDVDNPDVEPAAGAAHRAQARTLSDAEARLEGREHAPIVPPPVNAWLARLFGSAQPAARGAPPRGIAGADRGEQGRAASDKQGDSIP